MGAKNTKIKKTKINKQKEEKSLENKKILKENILLINQNKNPCFKKKEIFSHSNCIGFEIYKLKDINNAFYLAYSSFTEENIIIYKYFYEKEKFEKISEIQIYKGDLNDIIIKYFYNPLNNKEYLFFVRKYDDIEIVLIQKENKFEFINKRKKNSPLYEYGRDSYQRITKIELFENIYNQYDNNIYIIISYYLSDFEVIEDPLWISNNIKILKFKNNKLVLIKEFEFTMNAGINLLIDTFEGMNDPNELTKIIYHDKFSKKYCILMIIYNNLQFIEIKNKYEKNYQIKNFFELENDLQQFKETIKWKMLFKGCIINLFSSNDNTDYLYLYFNGKNIVSENYPSKGIFVVIDLLNKKIIKKIKINKYIASILNWNNKYLILQSNESFYIFDTRINKIISKYSNLSLKDLSKQSIKTFFSIKNNFYSLFVFNENINFFISN